MGRTAADRTRDAPRRRAAVTMEQIDAFLRSLERRGRAAGTIQAYRRSLTRFYQALPPEKRVGRDTLSRWRDDLLAQGYTAQTVNAALSAANSLLDFLGQRECQLVRRLAAAAHPRQPAGGAAGVHPAAGAHRRAGVRDPKRAAPVPDGGDRRHPEPGRGRPGGPGEVQPRCLRKLCQTTLAEIEADVRRLVEQTRDQLLEQEQRLVGWEARDPP